MNSASTPAASLVATISWPDQNDLFKVWSTNSLIEMNTSYSGQFQFSRMTAWPWLEMPISCTKPIVPAGDDDNKHTMWSYLAPRHRGMLLEAKGNNSCQWHSFSEVMFCFSQLGLTRTKEVKSFVQVIFCSTPHMSHQTVVLSSLLRQTYTFLLKCYIEYLSHPLHILNTQHQDLKWIVRAKHFLPKMSNYSFNASLKTNTF